MIKPIIKSTVNAASTVADNNSTQSEKKVSLMESLVTLITEVIVFVILLFIGKWLWNNFLAGKDGPGLCTVLKPVKNIGEILGITILISLLSNH